MKVSRRYVLALAASAFTAGCTPVGAPPPSATPFPPTPLPTRPPPTQPPPTPVPTIEVLSAQPSPTPLPTRVLPGVDVLLRDGLPLLEGKPIGLVTNATGRTANGRPTIDALSAAYKLVALFSPEHGIRGEASAGQAVESSTDAQTGLPIFSLYGQTTRPTDAMLRGIDVLVFDIQDVGARTYTYTSTLLEVLRAGAQHGIPVVVLDRPDPIRGDAVDGNVLDPRFVSFVGPASIAMRYGMTIGELGQFFNAELKLGADVHVVATDGWRRSMWFDDTGLEWINPSPNLRSLTAAALYTGTVLFEGTNVSVGRGTERPFEWVGAPWIDAGMWLSRLEVDGVTFTLEDRTPDSDKFAGAVCHGLAIDVADRGQLRPMALGVAMLCALGQGLNFDAATFDGLAGTDRLRNQILAATSAREIAAGWQQELAQFESKRRQYLIY